MLMLTGEIHDLRNFSFCNFVAENSDNGKALFVNRQHYFKGLCVGHSEKSLQNDNYEFHWRIIVVKQQDLIKGRPFLC